MSRLVLTAVLLALAACGADGEPQHPAPKAKPGVTVTGEASLGVSGGL
jgi:hypothetical protein